MYNKTLSECLLLQVYLVILLFQKVEDIWKKYHQSEEEGYTFYNKALDDIDRYG